MSRAVHIDEESARQDRTVAAIRETGNTSPAEQEPPPAQLGRYRVDALIGQGGMGVVYRAEHLDTGAPAAVKTVRVQLGSALAGLRAELRALSEVRHPGIVRVLDEGLADAVPWYAMELLEGRPLNEWLAELWSPFLLANPTTTGSAASLEMPRPPSSSGMTETGLAPADFVMGSGSIDSGPASQTSNLRAAIRITAADVPVAGGRLQEVLTLVRRMCLPLSVMHGAGIVHRVLSF